MHYIIQRNKSIYFNVYRLGFELLLLIICCFLFSCSQPKDTKQVFSQENQISPPAGAVNINTAKIEQLEKLPNVGPKIAQRIIEHREKYGRFRRPEHLLLIDGISDERFRSMKNLIRVE